MLTLTAYRLSIPLRAPMRTAGVAPVVRDLILVRAVDRGHAGWGEAAPWPGHTPLDVGDTWREVIGGTPEHEPARSAVGGALADLRARIAGVRLWQDHGASLDPLLAWCALSGGTPDECVQAAQAAIEEGHVAAKLKIMPGADVASLRAVAATFPSLQVGVDANGAYRSVDDEGLAGVLAMAPAYVEQPFAEDDLVSPARLRRITDVPIVADEAVTDLESAQQVVREAAADIVTVKIGRVGLEGAGAIRRWARDAGVPLKVSGLFETSVGKAHTLAFAAAAGVRLLDFAPAAHHLTVDVVSDPWCIDRGLIHPRPSPGTGVTVDESRVAELAIDRADLPVRAGHNDRLNR